MVVTIGSSYTTIWRDNEFAWYRKINDERNSPLFGLSGRGTIEDDESNDNHGID